MSDLFKLTRLPARLKIELYGNFDEADALALKEALQAQDFSPMKALLVLFDLRKIENCTILGRATLTDVQRWLRSQVKRTVFLSDKPRFRGLGLWISHAADDRNAKVVATMPDAERWFSGGTGRLASVEANATASLQRLRGEK